jgi:predicted dehydrogenase
MEGVMEKVRLAIIGFGSIGEVHVRSYLKHSEKAEVTAIVDPLEERRKLATEKFGIKETASDYNQILQRADIDAISVCVPTFLHKDLVVEAAKNGKHIFCEKPMAMTMEEAYEMERACVKAGVKFQIGFVRRYDNQWLKFKETVVSGKLGRPVVWRSAGGSHGAPSPWFFQREKGGGPFLDGAVHNYDFGNITFGKAKCVTARGTVIQKDRDGIDTGIAEVLYESGDRLQLMWSWGLKKGIRAGSLHDCLGEEGALLFTAPTKGVPPSENEHLQYLTIVREGGLEEPVPFERNDMFGDQMGDFLDSIIQNKEPKVTIKDGQESLRVGLAVLESFETGKTIYL